MLLAESLLVATCALAAIVDHRRGMIPGSLAVGACGVALTVHVAGVIGNPGDPLSLLGSVLFHWAGGALLTALVPFMLWRRNALGGGDLKLFAAIGAFLGPVRGLEASLWVFCLGSAVGLVALAREGVLGEALDRVAGEALAPLRRLFRRPAPVASAGAVNQWMRFGPTIFVGTCLSLGMHLVR